MTADVYEARTGFAAARRAFGTYGCVAVVVVGATFLPIPWAAKAMAVTLVVAFGPVMLLLAAFASRHRLVLRSTAPG